MNKTLTSHGGDIYTEGLLKGKELIDYSSNINLLGVPNSFYEGVKEATNLINHYPDIQYRSTKEAIIKYHKISIDNDNIILGNGAAEVLDLAVSTLRSICIIAPSFSEYEISSKKYGLELKYSYLNNDMTYNYEDILDKLKSCDGIIIANPNNPNGCNIDKERFKEILNYCEANEKRIIIDEAFVEFSGDKAYSFIDEVINYKSLILIRAITKYFALPGIRLGWAISSDKEILSKLREKQLPWNINTFAAISLKYLLEDREYIKKSLSVNIIEREFLINELRKISLFDRVFESNSNFLLCKLNNVVDQELFEFALNNGILIRKCGNYRGLDNSFIRLAVKSRENNRILLDMLRRYKNIRRI
ncbi:Threonine-phosphate decarboxylase [uncultured Clostridium sp.]|uniref:pyridoxal phosphate-dependent aminotransferase n=1 Tax=uncultured Clostridium sp. TaxID=59620 RepID=UPI000822F89F|nr:histidinol-phosphate transaminase [uncultured Clostridium sp.]SCK03877.1 Threonine-phosphate decarboxylase [uncultured Clostridium sp.]